MGLDIWPVVLGLAVTVCTLIGIAVTAFRIISPRISKMAETVSSMQDVLLGVEARPSNPITGHPGTAAVPPIGTQVAAISAKVNEIAAIGTQIAATAMDIKSVRDDMSIVKDRLEDGDGMFQEHNRRLNEIERLLRNKT